MPSNDIKYERVQLGPFKRSDYDINSTFERDQLHWGKNVIPTRDGSLIMRQGFSDATTSVHADYPTVVNHFAAYQTAAATHTYFVIGKGPTNYEIFYGSSVATLTSNYAPSAWSNAADTEFSSASFNQDIYCAAWRSTTGKSPVKFTGSTGTWSTLTGLGDAGGTGIYSSRTMTVFAERLFQANLVEEEGATDVHFPYRIRHSNLDAPTTFNTEDYIDLNPDDGGEIVKIVPFENNLLIFREHSIYVLSGRSKESFTIYNLSGQYGLSSKGSTIIHNEKIFFYYDAYGIVQFDGETFQPLTWPGGEYITVLTDMINQVDAFQYKGILYFSAQNSPSANPDSDWSFSYDPQTGMVNYHDFGWIHSIQDPADPSTPYLVNVNNLTDTADQKNVFEFGDSAKDDGAFIVPNVMTAWFTSESRLPFRVVKLEFDFYTNYFAAGATDDMISIVAEHNGNPSQLSHRLDLTGDDDANGDGTWIRFVVPYDLSIQKTSASAKGPRSRGVDSMRINFTIDSPTTRTISTWGIANVWVTLAVQQSVQRELTHGVTVT